MTVAPREPEFNDLPPTKVCKPDSLQLLAENLATEMAHSWRQGKQVLVEEFLERHPRIKNDRQAAFRLLCEEICLREELGLEISAEQFLGRFPGWSTEINLLLDCRHLLQTEEPRPATPPARIVLDDFQLMAELGQGALGRVYLASQISLAGRPLVLKITTCTGQEHLSLARLQHTHISPLYWVHNEPLKDQRILGMPFFGTVTLATLMVELKNKLPFLRTGKDILHVLARAQAKLSGPLGFYVAPKQNHTRLFLQHHSYPQVVAWIGACLADALQYAHDRDLVHLDLKPSNVLLAGDGQPLLLDFHLAHAPISAGSHCPGTVGGTPLYMSPEQRALIENLSEGKPVPRQVDGRSDIYSLGLILYQLLGGPITQTTLPRLEKLNPAVSVGLADILHKCLEKNPLDRYASAAALAADFRRHLDNKPLRGVPNRSLAERWRKWNRRKPQALYIYVLTGLFALLCLGGLYYYLGTLAAQERDNLTLVQKELEAGQADLKERRFSQAVIHFQEGLKRARNISAGASLARQLSGLVQQARREDLLTRLNSLTDQVRFAYSGQLSLSRMTELEKGCRALWQKRNEILDILKTLSEPARQCEVHADLIDLAVIGADLRTRLARGGEEAKTAHRAALDMLDETEKLLGAGPVLYHARKQHLQAMGREAPVARADDQRPPQTAWEHFALGRAFLQEGQLAGAAPFLDRAVELEPDGFWFNFYQGICLHRRGKYRDAAEAFRAALTLKPGSAAAYFNRGLARSHFAEPELALKDYGRALVLDPDLADAALNRGLLFYRLNRLTEAVADLKTALEKGSEPASGHYNLALVFQAKKNIPAAKEHVRKALQFRPDYSEARDLARQLGVPFPPNPKIFPNPLDFKGF